MLLSYGNKIIESVTYDNYDDFQLVHLAILQKFVSLFWGLFNDKTDLRVRYAFEALLHMALGSNVLFF
jgi:hypothetical protein